MMESVQQEERGLWYESENVSLHTIRRMYCIAVETFSLRKEKTYGNECRFHCDRRLYRSL
jgi:hypothetical protein